MQILGVHMSVSDGMTPAEHALDACSTYGVESISLSAVKEA
jgi:hypothetical protein